MELIVVGAIMCIMFAFWSIGYERRLERQNRKIMPMLTSLTVIALLIRKNRKDAEDKRNKNSWK